MTPTIVYRARCRRDNRWPAATFATRAEAKVAMRPPCGRHRATP